MAGKGVKGEDMVVGLAGGEDVELEGEYLVLELSEGEVEEEWRCGCGRVAMYHVNEGVDEYYCQRCWGWGKGGAG